MDHAERKTAPQFVKAVKGRAVTGVFAVYGNRDSYNDILHMGTFAKTFQERGKKIVHLWQHDMQSPPIAHITNLRELERSELPPELLRDFPEASGGAEVTREYLETPRASEVLANIQAGVPLEMSFAFDALKYDFEELPGATYEWEQIRNVREVRLWETSDVLWGANSATVASKQAESAILRQLADLTDRLGKLRKAGSRHSAGDVDLINKIAANAIALGATNATLKEIIEELEELTDDSAKSRAADLALTRSASRKLYITWRERQAALLEQGIII